MTNEELVMRFKEDISWLEQGCQTEREICDHIKQAIEIITQHKKTDNPWQTGTPSEKGWYVCKLKGVDIYETQHFTGNNWGKYVEKWQKIID